MNASATRSIFSTKAVEFLQNYPIVGIVIFALVLVLYLHLLFDRAKWRNLEIFLGISYFVSLLYADNMLSIWLDGARGDLFTKALFQLVLLGMSSQAFAFFFTEDSFDSIVDCSLTLTNILGRGGLLLAAVYAMINVKTISTMALKFDYVFLSILMIGDFIHLRKLTTKDGALTLGEPIRIHAAVDAMATFLLGALVLGFPTLFATFLNITGVITDVCKVFMKSFGFQLLAGSLLSLSTLSYKQNQDVASILKSKLVIYLPVSIFLLWQAFFGIGYSICGSGIVGFLLVNVLNGILKKNDKQD